MGDHVQQATGKAWHVKELSNPGNQSATLDHSQDPLITVPSWEGKYLGINIQPSECLSGKLHPITR